MHNFQKYFKPRYYIVYIWLAAVVIYFAHMYFENGPITKYAQGVVDVVNLTCMFLCLTHPMPMRMRAIIIPIVLLTICVFLYYFLSPVKTRVIFHGDIASSFQQLKLYLFCCTSIFPAIYFTKRQLLDENILKAFFIILVYMSVVSFLDFRLYLQEEYGVENGSNNLSYLIATIFPLCFCMNKSIRYFYIFLCLAIVFIGGKRGAIVLSIALIAYTMFKDTMRSGIYSKLLVVTFIIIIYQIINSEYIEIFQFGFDRLEQSGSSGRDMIAKSIINGMVNGSFINWIIGYGSIGSTLFADNFAHNDWLELLVDYGLIGLSIYAMFYWGVFKFFRSVPKQDITTKDLLASSLIVLLIKSLFSMCLFSTETAVVFVVLGYTIVNNRQNEKDTIIHR